MKHIIKAAAILVLTGLSGAVQGQVTTGHNVHEVSIGNIVRYLLYIPDSYNEEPTKKWPLLVHLHGTGGMSKSDKTYEENLATLWSRTVPALIENGDTRFDEFIVLTPQSTGWWGGSSINTLVDQIAATYSIDTNRLIVSGQSMGGYGTYKAIMDKPNKYAAAAPICPAYDVTNPDKIDHIPIWMHHGDRDPTVGYGRSVTNYLYLSELVNAPETTNTGSIIGTDFTTLQTGHISFSTYHGTKHTSWNETYARDDVIDWMAAQSLPGANLGPVLSLESPDLSSGLIEYGDTATLTVSATDAEGSVTSMRVELDDTLVQRVEAASISLPDFFRDLIPGNYTLRLSAVDNDGRETAEVHNFSIYTLPPPGGSLTIINHTASNGSFENPASGASSIDFWEDSLGLSGSIQREINAPNKASEGSASLKIGKSDLGETYGAAIKTGYTVHTGDQFYLSFNWRALTNPWDSSDAIEWRLLVTSDDTRNGTITELASGSVSGYDNIDYRPFYLDAIGPVNETESGRRLWLEIKTSSGVANGELALIDEVILHAITDGAGIDTLPPSPNPATWAAAPTAVDAQSITMTATAAGDISGPVQYCFNEISGHPGGTNSGWQLSNTYVNTGLAPDTEYTFVVYMRDAAGNTNRLSKAMSVSTTPLNAPYTVRIDFEDKNNTPTGGTWNVLNSPANRALVDSDGNTTALSIGSWNNFGGGAKDEATDFDFSATEWGESAQDSFEGDSTTDPGSLTLSGFAPTDTVTIRLIGIENNRRDIDYRLNGDFGSGSSPYNGDNYNSRNAWASGHEAAWSNLTGTNSYRLTATPLNNRNPVISAILINVTPAQPDPDSDGDGLPDSVETSQGFNPDLRDSDGDGIDDLMAYALDVDSFSTPEEALPTLGNSPTGMVYQIPKTQASNILYSVETAGDLTSTWYRVAFKLPGAAWQKDTLDDETPLYPGIGMIHISTNATGVEVIDTEARSKGFYRPTYIYSP